MHANCLGVIYDENENEVFLPYQERAKFIMGDDKIYLPISTHVKYPFRKTNIQEAKESVKVDRTILHQHPFFKTIYVSNRGRILNGDDWRWETVDDIPEEIITGFIGKEEYVEVERGYIYQTTTNLLNGVEYIRGTDVSEYPEHSEQKFFHPIYHDVFCNWIGLGYKQTETKTFSINISSYIKFYAENNWHYYSHEKFAYECYYQQAIPNDKKVEVINPKLKFKYVKSNLRLIDYNRIDLTGLLRHPKFKHYGYLNDAIYSVNAGKFIKRGSLVTIYNSFTHSKTFYNTKRFIYECKNQRLLNSNEFMVDDEVFNRGVDSFVYGGIIYSITSNPDIYLSRNNKAFYVPYEREMAVIDGFINVGNRNNPKLIPLPM